MAASEIFKERLQFYIYFFIDGLKSQLLDSFLLTPEAGTVHEITITK